MQYQIISKYLLIFLWRIGDKIAFFIYNLLLCNLRIEIMQSYDSIQSLDFYEFLKLYNYVMWAGSQHQ